MHDGGFFYQAFIYLTAAVVSVPIAKRLGLGSVLGYLLDGFTFIVRQKHFANMMKSIYMNWRKSGMTVKNLSAVSNNALRIWRN